MRATTVDRNNLASLYLAITNALARASFVAIDCEFTGLGGPSTRDQNIQLRYDALRNHVKSHALVAIGMSIFIHRPRDMAEDRTEIEYDIHNYNFVLFNQSETFKVSPKSLSFLVDSGFDFTHMIQSGIPYKPGPDPSSPSLSSSISTLPPELLPRRLFMDLFHHLRSRSAPLIFHNGFLDMMFLYDALYNDLPTSLEVFVADVNELVGKAGIYDTKYISEYERREEAQGRTYLAYLFRKTERLYEQWKGDNDHAILVCHLANHDGADDGQAQGSDEQDGAWNETVLESSEICVQYARHGHCQNGSACLKSHNMDRIIDRDEAKQKRRKVVHEPFHTHRTLHTAHFDAFMTGYVFAHFIHTPETMVLGEQPKEELNWRKWKNRIYLIGKSLPLLIEKSIYVKPSASHTKKIKQYLG